MTTRVKVPSGYAASDDFFATLGQQGSLEVMSLTLTWRQIMGLVGPVDPNTKSEYNRPLTVSHAKQFGQYVDINATDAFSPPITLFTDPANVEFEGFGDPVLDKYGLMEAKIRRGAQLYILDGQHRIFGVELLYKDLNTLLDRAKQDAFRAKKSGDEETTKQANKRVRDVQRRLDRLDDMEITVQVLLTAEGDLAKRIFTDVADNAKGISRSQLAEFSDRSVFNRVARDVSATLLQGVVDPVHDRMSSKNPNWLALKDVVNVAQALEYPIGKRWTAQRESELVHREAAIDSMTRSFFEGLKELYPQIGAVLDGSLPPREIRAGGDQPSLLGSSTMIRAMASAYRRLRIGERGEDDKVWTHKPMGHPDIVQAWDRVLPPMDAGNVPDPSDPDGDPVPRVDKRWLATGAFSHPYYAPGARQGDLNALAETIAEWTWDDHEGGTSG
ncbi:MAG: DNA sulfur modification protein DndB [Acidimicrobiia bacterium]|jgi:hypothetical protein